MRERSHNWTCRNSEELVEVCGDFERLHTELKYFDGRHKVGSQLVPG